MYDWPVECIWNFCPDFMVPFFILISDTTPKYESNQESIINAWRLAFGSPFGLGMFETNLSNRSSIPSPVFALTSGA